MTEVPEHLLQRSRERRQALGLEGGGGGESGAGAAPAGESGGGGAVAVAEATAPAETEGGGAVAVATEDALPSYTGPPQITRPKPRVPVWAAAVLAILPFWALFYVGAFGERKANEVTWLSLGESTFSTAGCSTCHGAQGQGGVGPALANVHSTFPDIKDQISWVETGSKPFQGKVYGKGTRVATGGMPAFKGAISDNQIKAVVCYERVTFGHGDQTKDCPAGTPGAATTP